MIEKGKISFENESENFIEGKPQSLRLYPNWLTKQSEVTYRLNYAIGRLEGMERMIPDEKITDAIRKTIDELESILKIIDE